MRSRSVGAGVLLTFALVLSAAGPSAAGPKERPPKDGGGSPQTSTAEVTAPYEAVTVSVPADYGLTASKDTGGIRAVDFPVLTKAGPFLREAVARVGSASPIGEWRTATVSVHVTEASVSTTLDPSFEAYIVLATGGMNTPYDGEYPLFYCATSPLFHSTDTAGGTGIDARVSDRTVQLTCANPAGSSSSAVWGGVYLRTNAGTSIDFDATLTSITFSR